MDLWRFRSLIGWGGSLSVDTRNEAVLKYPANDFFPSKVPPIMISHHLHAGSLACPVPSRYRRI